MSELHRVTTRDDTSGRFHFRYLQLTGEFDRDNPLGNAERVLVDERCQTDQSGAFTVMFENTRSDSGDGIPVGTDPSRLCRFCFASRFDDE